MLFRRLIHENLLSENRMVFRSFSLIATKTSPPPLFKESLKGTLENLDREICWHRHVGLRFVRGANDDIGLLSILKLRPYELSTQSKWRGGEHSEMRFPARIDRASLALSSPRRSYRSTFSWRTEQLRRQCDSIQ